MNDEIRARGWNLEGNKKGQRRGGRNKGTRNKIANPLRDGVLLAAAILGANGRGRGSVQGYLTQLAEAKPRAFLTLLQRQLSKETAPARPKRTTPP